VRSRACLLFRRGRAPVPSPGGDGAVVAAGGSWVCFLVFYRFIDNKEGNAKERPLLGVDYALPGHPS